MEFHFDFDVSSSDKERIMETAYNSPCNKDRDIKHCVVQKFKTYEEARMVHDILRGRWWYIFVKLYEFGNGDEDGDRDRDDPWSSLVLTFARKGEPFIPCKSELYELQRMYDGKVKALFITEYYKQIMRSLISDICQQKILRIRYRIDIDSIYTYDDRIWGDHPNYRAFFVRFDVLPDSVQNDDSDVVENLKNLFERINNECGNDDEGGWKAEFELLFDEFTLAENPKELNKILDNVIFWTKAERIEFLKNIINLSKSKEVEIYGEYTSDVFGTDWAARLTGHPHMEMLVEQNKPLSEAPSFETNPEECMLYFIDTIVYAYDNVAQLPEETAEFIYNREISSAQSVRFKDADQVVEFVQYCFPTLFGALAQRAKKLNWAVPLMVEEFLHDKRTYWAEEIPRTYDGWSD